MKTKTIILFLLFIAACNTGNKKEIIIIKETDFQKDKMLIGEYLNIYPTPHCPENILIIDSLLIIKNGDMCNDDFFYIYNKNDNKFLNSFGKRGRGPKEFLSVKMSGQYVKNENSIKIWVHNRTGFKLINITRSVEENRIVIDDEIIYKSQEFHPVLDAFLLPNINIIGKSLTRLGRLFYYDSNDNKINWIEYFPKVTNPPFDEDMIVNLYIGPTSISPDNSRIVSALELFKRIDVFSEKTDHLFSLVFDGSPENPDFYVNPNNPIPNDLMHYYYDLFLTDKFIYALNINISEAEINKDLDSGYSEIHVFCWAGKPIAIYRLNHLIYSITVDENKGYLYGLLLPDEKEFYGKIGKFKLR